MSRLPFYGFENNLRLSYDPISLPSPPRGFIVEDQAADGDIDHGFTSFQNVIALEGQLGGEVNSTNHSWLDTWTPDSSVLTALESVVPQPIVDESLHDFPLTHLDIRVFPSPLHRQILFCLANNLAGLHAPAARGIFHFLQKEPNKKLYQTVRSAQGYTARAVIQILFKAAVEAGDARIADILIRENPADIKINEQSCVVYSEKYTPIERATLLRHEELVEVFLRHGAEVNRTYAYLGIGALDFAVVGPYRGPWGEENNPPHPRIFRKLLEKGGELCESAIKSLVRRDGELTILIMSTQTRENAAQWCRWGVFCEAIMFLDDHSSMKIIEIMLECGVDLNHDVDTADPSIATVIGHSYRVIDEAARRGQLSIVDLLLKSGASLTGNTLPCAVKSQNKDLIRLLLESGADINSIGSLEITTLSVAIELRYDHMIRFLEEQGASVINQSKEHCAAAVLAASEVGKIQFIEELVWLGCKVNPQDLGYALWIATIDDRDEDVKKLINVGADVNLGASGRRIQASPSNRQWRGPPLYEVLKRRKESLTSSLLNAGANPNDKCHSGCHSGCHSDGESSSIQLAIQWGNRSVIEALISAGVDVNCCGDGGDRDTALAIAVKRRDFGLIKLLLASGADINPKPAHRQCDLVTPLEAAAEMGDVEMAKYLIDQGADPNNSGALEWSVVKNQELFDLLCQTYHARYPSARGDFGIRVLMHAIEDEDHDGIKKLLQSGVNAEAKSKLPPFYDEPPFHLHLDHRPMTALGYAFVQQKEAIVEYLLQYGCDPNGIVLEDDLIPQKEYECRQVRLSRERAIVAAIGTQRSSMVELLINHRAKVNFPTFGPINRTPLQRAAELGNIEIVTLLINNGADINAQAAHRRGGTSLQLAAIGGYIPVACKLLNHKADVHAPGSKIYGRTALEGAAEHGRLDMIKLLLNAGAGSRRGDEGQVATAITLARGNDFYHICDLLESHFHRRQGQDSGPEMLLDGSDDDNPRDWNLDEDGFVF